MSMVDALHSRERLAGYDPATLFQAIALVVGTGALGQNILQDLALAGFGELDAVDYDDFEPHNATRSPLYPTPAEQAHWGLAKAQVVARKLVPLMTAPTPVVRYANAPIQAIGDLPIARTDIVFAAVDNPAARAYLAERCRLLGRPLIEAGFHGASLSLTVFGTDAEAACYRCLDPETVGAFSCTHYARAAAAAQIIPAIQNAAAVLAGLQAEQGILWLHGEAPLLGKRAYVDLRTLAVTVAELLPDPHCPGTHWTSLEPAIELPVGTGDHVEMLLRAATDTVGQSELRLPAPVAVRIPCTACRKLCAAAVPTWRWLADPRCIECGGPFPLAAPGRGPASLDRLHIDLEPEILDLPCEQLGLVAGTTVEAWLGTGDRRLLRLRGTIDEVLQAVSPSERGMVPGAF